MEKRKICFVITSSIHYSRNKLILEQLHNHSDFHLQIVLGGSALIGRFGNFEQVLAEDGFEIAGRVSMVLDSSENTAMAKSTGIGLMGFADTFERLKPDIVIIRGDRYEMLAPTIAAAYMNITIAHIEGGDITGSIDESVRHAITKLAHIHFCTNKDSERRINQMGEHPDRVFNVGSPELEVVEENDFSITPEYIHGIGVGDVINFDKSYIILMQHSVTTEVKLATEQVMSTLDAVIETQIPTIWFWPNIDAGSEHISKQIRKYREAGKMHHVRFLKYLPQDQFYGLLKKSSCLIGNSSSGIKEASFIGLPVVNIGSRQHGRKTGRNVRSVEYDKVEIVSAIKDQVNHGFYESDKFYYKPGTSKVIADTLASVDLFAQKEFYDG